jgi:DNA-binding beta-propeller fold protein YncE
MGADAAVWPSPPEAARYRFVGQLTGEENFRHGEGDKENAGVRFLRWVVGLTTGKPIPNILQRPQSGMVDAAGRIYVTDVSRQAVGVFDPSASTLKFFDLAAANTPFQSPIAIAEGAADELLVTDSKLAVVVRLSRSGEPLGQYGKGVLTRPVGIARDAKRGRVYVADSATHRIAIFDDLGNFLRSIGDKGDAPGQFNSPTFVSFANDTLYVSDTMNSRVQLLSPEGDVRKVFGRRGLFIGDMPRPKGVAVDQLGLIYVVESYYDHLLVFDPAGEFLLPIGGSGQAPGQFYLPAGVWSDNNKRVYVADMFNGRVVVFEFLGEGV